MAVADRQLPLRDLFVDARDLLKVEHCGQSRSISAGLAMDEYRLGCGLQRDSGSVSTFDLLQVPRFPAVAPHAAPLLPDDAGRRVQIGSRSAITGRDAVNPKHLDRLLDGL